MSKNPLLRNLGLAFIFAAASYAIPGLAQERQSPSIEAQPNYAEPGHTYWKHPASGTVLDLWRCSESGLCFKFHQVNPKHGMTRFLASKALNKRQGDLTDIDVMQFCGYQPVLEQMAEKLPNPQNQKAVKSYAEKFGLLGQWEGRITLMLPKPGETAEQLAKREPKIYGLNIEEQLNVEAETLKNGTKDQYVDVMVPRALYFKGHLLGRFISWIGGGAHFLPESNPGKPCVAPAGNANQALLALRPAK